MPQSNLENRTIFCKDNLDILQGINSNSIDLIYLDPPFNKKKVFTAPIGSSAEGASFKDYFREEDVKNEWVQTIKEDNDKLHALLESVKTIEGRTSYNFCYLAYMAIRLLECHRILKETGSIYLHCDPTMSHYLKLLMDIIFDEKNFRNEIIWHYRRWTGKAKSFQKLHDIVFFYVKNEKKYNFNQIYTEYTINSKERKKQGTLNRFSKDGEKYHVSYKDLDKRGVRENDVWHIPYIPPSAKERVGYPTQKPLALLERIIKASSREGDIVLDPFCGCATTCVASEKLERQWIGIDVSVKAYDLVKERLKKEVANPEYLTQYQTEVNFSIAPPKRTDLNGNDKISRKYVYVISNPAFKDMYKAGVASDCKSRLNTYQTSDPDRGYKLEYKLHTHLFRKIEKHIHDKFDNKHEWIRANKEDIIKEINSYKHSISI